MPGRILEVAGGYDGRLAAISPVVGTVLHGSEACDGLGAYLRPFGGGIGVEFLPFFRSKHVRDFKLICTMALSVFLFHLFLASLGIRSVKCISHGAQHGLGRRSWRGGKTPANPGARLGDSASAFFSFVIRYIGAAVPIYGIIIGWGYQSASKRLGIVDLFACEISTPGLFNALYKPLYERLIAGSRAAAHRASAIFVMPLARAMLSA